MIKYLLALVLCFSVPSKSQDMFDVYVERAELAYSKFVEKNGPSEEYYASLMQSASDDYAASLVPNTANSSMAMTTGAICSFHGQPPLYVPYCGVCINGEGSKLDPACVSNARSAWEDCEKEACRWWTFRYDMAQADYDEWTAQIISDYLQCVNNANGNQAIIQQCFDTARSQMDAANAALAAEQAVIHAGYLADVHFCDMAYINAVLQCCVPCDPWDGWPNY